MSATVRDVAKLAGVSVATVSKYMNGGNLREDYRERVEKAVHDLDYSINEVARYLKTNKTFLIGVLVPSITSSFLTDIISSIQKYLMENGYTALVLDYQKSHSVEMRQLDVLLSWNVDGIILFPGFHETDIIEKIKRQQIPLLLIDNLLEGVDCDAVVINNYESSYSAVEKLISSGHKSIGLIAGPSETYSASERRRGFLEAVAAHGVTAIEANGKYTIDGGYNATKELMQVSEHPTALLSSNYHMTIGMLRALGEMNLKIPEDVSVITFDEQEFDFALPTPITAIVQPVEEISRAATKLILSKIGGTGGSNSHIEVLDTQCKLTDSVKQI